MVLLAPTESGWHTRLTRATLELGSDTGAQEVAVKRMHGAILVDGLAGGAEGLAKNLPAKDKAPAQILTLSAKEIVFQALQGKEGNQFV